MQHAIPAVLGVVALFGIAGLGGALMRNKVVAVVALLPWAVVPVLIGASVTMNRDMA